MSLTLHQLKLSVSAAANLSITQTARQYSVSPSAVSQAIKTLEDEFGQTFIQGSGHGVELTATGKDFFKDAKFVLSGIDELYRNYGAKPQKSTAEALAIGASHATSAWLVPTLMARFKQSHPAVALDLYTGSSAEIEKLLQSSKVDIALVTSPTRSAELNVEPLRSERLAAFVRRNHPLAKKRKIAPEELARYPLVIRKSRSGKNRTDELLGNLAKIGLRSPIAMRFESGESVKSAVRNGSGVGILYRDIIKADVRRKEFAILPLVGIDLTARSYILYPKEKSLAPAAEQFLTLLRKLEKYH